MKKRNGALYFWAFIFCMIFVLHYAYFFDPKKLEKGAFYFFRGELAIDYFFVVIGVMLAKTVDSIPGDRALTWREYGSFVKRILRFYLPAFAICWAVTFVALNKMTFIDVPTLINNFFTALLELLPFRNVGFNAAPVDNLTFVGYRVMDQGWVISAAFIALVLLYPLYRRGRKRFEYYIAPVGAVLLLCFLFFKTKILAGDNLLTLDAKIKPLFYSFPGTYKGIAEILAGVTCFTVARHFSGRSVSKAGSHLLSVVEIGGYLAAIWYMQFMFRFELPEIFDYLAVSAMILGVTVSLSGKSSIAKLFDHKPVYFLGRFSLYPFLTFMVFAKTLPYFLPGMGLKKLTLIYLGLTLVSAVVVMLLEKPFVRLVKSLKKLFIKPQPDKEAA